MLECELPSVRDDVTLLLESKQLDVKLEVDRIQVIALADNDLCVCG